jgi:hypothetical protein
MLLYNVRNPEAERTPGDALPSPPFFSLFHFLLRGRPRSITTSSNTITTDTTAPLSDA